MTAEYRTPEEETAQAVRRARIQLVLDQARQRATSVKVAMLLGESPEVVERWVDALWDGLRDGLRDDGPMEAGLVPEDRLAAIILLLEADTEASAKAVLRGLADA